MGLDTLGISLRLIDIEVRIGFGSLRDMIKRLTTGATGG
jgi:hypothetical protein